MTTQTTVTERPILMSGEMIRALLAGKKTQTRRPLRPQPDEDDGLLTWCPPGARYDPRADLWVPSAVWRADRPPCDTGAAGVVRWCPHGVPGDRLWCRETWCLAIRAGTSIHSERVPHYAADGGTLPRWNPSIFMPRALSRITLEITEVRVERLGSLTPEDALAEGTADYAARHSLTGHYTTAFARLWDSTNGKRPGCSWKADPWVWCVSFKRLEPPPCP